MMKPVITWLFLAAVSAPLAAYAGADKGAISDEQLTRMQQQLELSNEQLTEMRKIRDDGGSKKEIRAVLSDDQKTKAQELKQAREKSEKSEKASKAKGQNEGKPEVSDEQLARMQESLGLSDEQLVEMRRIRDDGGSAKEMRAVLTEEQKSDAKAKKEARKKQKKEGENKE